MIEGMFRAVLSLAMETGEISRGDYEITAAFKDSVIIDDNTLIENNINLVAAGLKLKISAIMETMKCDEATAQKELDRINAETAVVGVSDGEGFGDMNDEGAV